MLFRWPQRSNFEVWPFVRQHVSRWTLISKTFCNYSLGSILYSWSPSKILSTFGGRDFCLSLYSFIFISVEVVSIREKTMMMMIIIIMSLCTDSFKAILWWYWICLHKSWPSLKVLHSYLDKNLPENQKIEWKRK